MATKNSPSSSSSSSSSIRICLCAPTAHPGSFRCSLHRTTFGRVSSKSATVAPRFNGKDSNAATMTMMTTTSKARLIKAFLMHIIKPSSHHLQIRRRNFQPKPTRFCLLNSSASANGVPVS